MKEILITIKQLVFDPVKKETKTQEYTILKEDFMYYLDDSKTLQPFMPYEVKGDHKYSKDTLIPNINLIKELLIDSKDKIKMINIIQKSHKEDIDKAWEQIEYIKNQKFGQEEKEKAKKKGKRVKKIPIECCKSIKEMDNIIICVNSYTKEIDGKKYFIDLYECEGKKYFVRLTDITDGYNEIDFDSFKDKYCQPTLFDYFEI